MRRRWGAAAVVAAVAAAAAVAAGGGEPAEPARAQAADTATAPVERRDLVDRETVSGRQRYADPAPLLAGAGGTLTRLRPEGAAVRRGGWLYEIDGERTGWLLYGRRPPWRDLGPGSADGADIRQLERNLAALGYAPGTVDGEWSADTTAAVARFQADRDLTEDGTLARGEIVFRPGSVRIGEAKAQAGRTVGPGMELGTIASTRREVHVDLAADRQELAARGARVTVDLPDGRRARGRIGFVGAVASAAGQDGVPTVEVRVELRGRAAHRSGLDQAPVDVGFEAERAENALAVPVTALLAQPGGGFAVQVTSPKAGACDRLAGEGCFRFVEVEPGLHADGLVEVSGDLRPGERVVVPS